MRRDKRSRRRKPRPQKINRRTMKLTSEKRGRGEKEGVKEGVKERERK